MKNLILFVITILITFSCSHNNSANIQKNRQTIGEDWDFILRMEKEHWDRNTVIANLGVPSEVINDEKTKSTYLIYLYENLGRSKWSIGFMQDNKLTAISFFPNQSNDQSFSIEKITEKWGKECVKKFVIDNSQHFIQKKKYLDCGHKRKARLNNLNQVDGLFIEL